ncbi:hypothetical protein EVAR_103433_1 [Eumeta japonica]|uniref:Secreted protein n=1 Tax=Eumeta variegata TaxID=151549 RepID=A0A4C1ZCB0_EUMVA|nr:hypothetical protein EVAR_103433_1 [Eumeta japonica]
MDLRDLIRRVKCWMWILICLVNGSSTRQALGKSEVKKDQASSRLLRRGNSQEKTKIDIGRDRDQDREQR